MIERIVKEQHLGGFGYGFVKEEPETEDNLVNAGGVMSPLESNESWSKLKQFFKDYYTQIKTKVSDVSPSEFNEIEMVINAIISLAKEYNLNNKNPEVIAQQLKRHMKDLTNDIKSADNDSGQPLEKAPKLQNENRRKGRPSGVRRK
tara:strand:- start:133 stop:573 length:441 start_codon:yes stop_codon:yes gene_type:complete